VIYFDIIFIDMNHLAIILSDIRSTFNVGNIMRTADCFGIEHIYFAGYTPYPKIDNDDRLPHEYGKITASIKKTALGAEETVAFSVHKDTKTAILAARDDGYLIAALEQAEGSQLLSKYLPPEKLSIVLGNEVEGISREIISLCDVILEIPMLGTKESLNVSNCAAIAMYAIKFGNN